MSTKFTPGQLLITPGARDKLSFESLRQCLARHLVGDWGELDTHDRGANERALIEGSHLFSAYCDSNGVAFWIITEADRSATTVLLPEEY